MAPAIDGELGEWAGGSYPLPAYVYGCSLRCGAADLSAQVYLGWDASNLYLAVQVRDDKIVVVRSGRNLYLSDDVEIQFDANLAADFTSTSLSSDDYQLGLSTGNFGPIATNAYRWYPRSAEGSLSAVVVKGKQLADGYTLEAKIPWTVFGVTPVAGAKYGFAVSVSDDDQTGVEALDRAEKGNPDIQAARERATAQGSRIESVDRLRWPRLDLTMGWSQTNLPAIVFMGKLNAGEFTQNDFAIDSLNTRPSRSPT